MEHQIDWIDGALAGAPGASVALMPPHHILRDCRAESACAAPLPSEAGARKRVPIATGCIDYFPDALAAVAALSYVGNEQHNPGKPLHWDRSKSTDEADALMRHFVQRGTLDADGVRHSAKVAWRALALLQKEIEAGTPAERADGCQ